MAQPKSSRLVTEATLETTVDDRISAAGIPQGAITSTQIGRIVAVAEGDPLPTLEDGDLVVRYAAAASPGTIYYKDFSGDTLDAAPAGMTKLLTGTATVQEAAGATGGKALNLYSSSPIGYAITAAMEDPLLADTEILVRWKTSTARSHGLSVWMNVDAVSDSMYRGTYNLVGEDGRARITVRVNGVNMSTPETSFTQLPLDTWVMTRTQNRDGVIRVKHWAETDPEPGWTQELADTRVATGPAAPAGWGGGSGSSFNIDWIVQATGGKAAVKP